MFYLDWVPIVCCLWIKPGSKPNRKLETEQDRLPDNEVINQSNNQSINQSIKQLIIFNYLTIWYYGENVRCLTFLKSSKRNLKSIQWILNQPTARGLRTTNKRIIFGSAKESAEMAERSSVELDIILKFLEVFDLKVFYHEYIFIGLRQFYN